MSGGIPGTPGSSRMAALTTLEHQTAMDKLEAEKAVLSAQIEEQNKKLRALQKACTDLTMMVLCHEEVTHDVITYPTNRDWTSQQRAEWDERNKQENEVRPMLSPHELRNRS